MSKHQNVLVIGASLGQMADAYFDEHPLDHDDDVEAEHDVHAFDVDNSNINTTQGLQG